MDNSTTIKPTSGEKYHHRNGIKDGIKISVEYTDTNTLKKPNWFKVSVPSGTNYSALKKKVHRLNLSSVCEESKCPNIAECWNNKTATLGIVNEKFIYIKDI